MSTTSPADETSSEASTSTRTPTEEAGDDAASDAVGDAETTTQVTKAPTVAARRASTVTFEPRQCRETVGETSPPDVEKTSSAEAMLSPGTKVEFRLTLYRSPCL